MSLGPNGVNRVCSLRKIMTRLRGTMFCTSSARFALSFVRQPNGPKCIQIEKNTPKYEFRVQWGGSRALVAKNLAHFVLSVVMEPNCPKCTQVVQNALKHEVRVQWGGSGAFVSENSDTTSWHKLLHQFGLFCMEFCKAN